MTSLHFEDVNEPERVDLQPARMRRLQGGLEGLRSTTTGLDGERLLFLLGAALTVLGFLLIGLAWFGVSGTGLLYEQMPFVVSGAVGGLACVIAGAAMYVSWWATRAVREARAQHAQLFAQGEAMLAALQDLRDLGAPARRRR